VAALLAVLLPVLAACAAIPTSGPVAEGDARLSWASTIDVLAEGPQVGAQPQEIVQGFLLASSAGFGDDFGVARQYLAPQARSSWRPLAGIVVAGPLEYSNPQRTQVVLDVPVVARIDAEGRYAQAPPEASESVTFDMVRDDAGQWRIASAPDGVILPESVVDDQLRSTPVFFLSPDEAYLVPEIRWFPARNIATSVVKALLDGPSPWLRDAVTTAVPDGVQLTPEAVYVDADGVAQVTLGPAPTVLSADRPLLLAQIEASLRLLPGVGTVRVQAGQGGPSLENAVQLARPTAPSGPVEFIQGDRLVEYGSDGVSAVAGVNPLTGLDARYPARDSQGGVRVMLSGPDRLVTVPTVGEDIQTLVTGDELVAPSVDRFGWSWTASRTGGIVAARIGDDNVDVGAEWLDGRIVRALRVSPDATRIAVVSLGGDGYSVDVAGIDRDESGTPQQLGEPVQVGASLTEATAVVWVGGTTLGVVGRSGASTALHMVQVGGTTEALPEVADLAAVAGGATVYVGTSTGELRRLSGPTWVTVSGVQDASYPYYAG